MECVVEFEYEANEDDELTLNKGDIITNVSTYEDGWMKGTLRGKEGVFPDNFVKIIKSEAKPPEKVENKVDATRKSQEDLITASMGRRGVAPVQKRGQGSHQTYSPGQKVRVIHKYVPRQKDELALELGAVIEIMEMTGDDEDDGWLKGSANGKVGVFPSNFVAALSPSSIRRHQAGSLDSGDNLHTTGQGKKVIGVGFGNIFTGEPIQLKTASVREVKRDSEEMAGQEPMFVPRPQKPVRVDPSSNQQRVIVKYPYTSENPDELTIEKGDIIVVVDKNLEDDGWWKGELNGKVGVFPDNFVEPYPIGGPAKDDKPKPARPVPPLPTEKPSAIIDKLNSRKAPPAIAKKPAAKVTPANGRPDHKGDGLFEGLPDHQPLQPLTSARPRVANKRPPTKEFLRAAGEDASAEKEEEKAVTRTEPPPRSNLKPAPHVPAPPPAPAPVHTGPMSLSKTSPVGITANKALPQPPPSAAMAEPGVSAAELAELRREFDSRLLQEIKEVRSDMERMRSALTGRIHSLTAEIDEEKRLRHSAQVELERVRRMLQERELSPGVPLQPPYSSSIA